MRSKTKTKATRTKPNEPSSRTAALRALAPYFVHLFHGKRRVRLHVIHLTRTEAKALGSLIVDDERACLNDLRAELKFARGVCPDWGLRTFEDLVDWWLPSDVEVCKPDDAIHLAFRVGEWLAITPRTPPAYDLSTRAVPS